MTSINT